MAAPPRHVSWRTRRLARSSTRTPASFRSPAPTRTRFVYAQAARAIASYHEDVGRLDLKQLRRIPNVGKAIAEKIVEFVRSGRCGRLRRPGRKSRRGWVRSPP